MKSLCLWRRLPRCVASLFPGRLTHIPLGPAAAGGRYDALVKSLWPAAAGAVAPPPGAVGLTVNADRLVAAVTGASARGRAGPALKPSQVLTDTDIVQPNRGDHLEGHAVRTSARSGAGGTAND